MAGSNGISACLREDDQMSKPVRKGRFSAEARACLERDGPNETEANHNGSSLTTISEVVREPMLLISARTRLGVEHRRDH